MRSLSTFIHFLRFCWRIWRAPDHVAYFAIFDGFGVPQWTALTGKGREAWEVTQIAIEHQLTHGKMTK